MIASHDMALARRRAIGLLMDHTIRVLAEVDAQQEAEEEASAEFVSRATAVLGEGGANSRSILTPLRVRLMPPLLAAGCSNRRAIAGRTPVHWSGSRGLNPVPLRVRRSSTHELLPLLVWLLITGWLTLWRGHSRVCPALLMHHPDVVLPADPSVCAELADCPDRCALLHAAGAPSVRAGS